MSQDPTAFSDCERLLHSLAFKVKRRLMAAGAASVQTEDVFQELVIAYCVARDSFNSNLNVPFKAYLWRGCLNHINRWVDKEIKERLTAPVSLDFNFGSDEGLDLNETVADQSAEAPDEAVIEKDMIDFVTDPMRWRGKGYEIKPATRLFLDILRDPPPALIEMYRGLRARAEYARSRGMTGVIAPNHITGSMVFDLMGANRLIRSLVYKDLQNLREAVNQQ